TFSSEWSIVSCSVLSVELRIIERWWRRFRASRKLAEELIVLSEERKVEDDQASNNMTKHLSLCRPAFCHHRNTAEELNVCRAWPIPCHFGSLSTPQETSLSSSRAIPLW